MDSLYNIFNPSDPIAYAVLILLNIPPHLLTLSYSYMLNPCVDSECVLPLRVLKTSNKAFQYRKARTLPPSVIPTFNASFMSSMSQRVSRLFNDVMPRSFTSSPPKSADPRGRSPEGRPIVEPTPTSFELGGHQEALQGSRAERRFVPGRFILRLAKIYRGPKICCFKSPWHP